MRGGSAIVAPDETRRRGRPRYLGDGSEPSEATNRDAEGLAAAAALS
jgi:hypothetical protein